MLRSLLTRSSHTLLPRAGRATAAAGAPRRALSTSSDSDDGDEDETLYELRTYQLKPERFMDYLALTGSDAFKARTDASKLSAFFMVEMGGVLCNSVVHLWEYDSLDHRTDVRAHLAGDAGFGEYIATIRPWLVSQDAVLTRGILDEEFVEGAAAGSGKYMLQSFASEPSEFFFDEDSPAQNVGNFQTVIGDTSEEYRLIRASTFQQLLEGGDATPDDHNSTLLIPTPFSPAQ
jgi:hypothetical protein